MPENEDPAGGTPDPEGGGQQQQHDEWTPPASPEELNRIVQQRLKRETAKFADYDSFKQRAGLYDQLLAQTQTDQERAAAEAEERAYNAAMGSMAPRLAKAEFRAAAKGLLDNEQLDALLEDVDLTKYIGEDGEADTDKITRKIKAVAPKAPPPPSFGQGPRGTGPKTADMNQWIRQQAGVTPG